MPSNKAPRIVPTRVIKDCLPIILPLATSIINASLSSSTFPGIWKTAEITPIPKQGNHKLPNNNRPISLLPALSKVCERVANNQFVTYLTTKKRLTTKQNGSKKWHSTETSLLHMTDPFLKGIDNNKLTACVLLDMSTAFDSVDQQILLRKLQDVGTSTSVLQWLNSHISQIDIKLYEFTPLFPIQYQLNMEYLRVASLAPDYLVYKLMIYQKLHGIALLNAM